jgi:hypothetical protein
MCPTSGVSRPEMRRADFSGVQIKRKIATGAAYRLAPPFRYSSWNGQTRGEAARLIRSPLPLRQGSPE